MDVSWVSIATHLTAYAAGAWTAYALVTRRLRVVEHDGHLAVTVKPKD